MASLGRWPTAVLCAAALALAVGYCTNDNVDPNAKPGATYHRLIAAGDGHMHFLITRSLVFDRDLNFDNDLQQFGDPWNQPRTVTGKKNVMQQIGPSLIWAPLLAVAHGLALVANVFGAEIPTHGYTLFHQRILYASSVVFALLAIAFAVAIARRCGMGPWPAVFAAVAALLGTSVTYYATVMPGYAHAMDAAACAIFLGRWVWTLGDLRWRRYVELGVWLGLAALVRIQDLGFGIVVAIELLLLAWQMRDVRVLARGAVVLAIALVMFTPELYEWNNMYGSWLTTPQGPGQMRYGHPMVLELLFSSRNGWLSSHPIAYAGVVGLGLGVWRGQLIGPRVRLVCGALLAAICVQVYINAVTYEWWSGIGFGQRRMCSSTLSVAFGVGVLLTFGNHAMRKWAPRVGPRARRAIAAAVLGWFVAWNIGWAVQGRHGVTGLLQRTPACCANVAAPLKWLAQPVYDAVGNPFELPASAVFAVKHGVDLKRWDVTVGTYPLVPGVLGYEDGSYRRETANWSWSGAGGASWIVSGLGPSQKESTEPAAKPFRWTVADRAEVLLPLLMPEPHRVTLALAANAAGTETVDVTIECNGAVVAHAAVGAAWQNMVFDTDGKLGENQIVITTPVRPYRGGLPGPADGAPVGVALGQVRIGLPPLDTSP